IWAVSKKTSDDMADAAILNLNENLNLMESTVEAIQDSEAQFQRLLATELAAAGDPAAAVERLGKSDAAALISVVPQGADVGVSNDGAPFDPASLDFSAGGGPPVSQPTERRGQLGLHGEVSHRTGRPHRRLYTGTPRAIDQSLPQGFYGQRAVLYLMDAATERFVLKPEGMGERDAGHVNLEDFYRANNITDPAILAMVEDGIANRENIMFAHKVKGTEALCYLWSIGDGTTYLVGYVPMEAIQREAQAVNVAWCGGLHHDCGLLPVRHPVRLNQPGAGRRRESARREQLAQALRAAEVANESKSAFLAYVPRHPHPMNAVLGFTTIIEKEADNPAKVRDCAGKIMASGRRLINDVLTSRRSRAATSLTGGVRPGRLSGLRNPSSPMPDKGQTFCAKSAPSATSASSATTHLNQVAEPPSAPSSTPRRRSHLAALLSFNALEHLRIGSG
ncbi:MAG: hypothetical protein ACLTMP_14190, partial [Eggerthella lenta]